MKDRQASTALAVAPPASPEASGGRPLAAVFWMVLAQLLFATMNLLARIASAKAPWVEVAAARMAVGAATALAFGLARRAPLGFDRRDRALAWARSLCGTGAMLCTFYALGAPKIALGDAVTLGATSPIYIALLAPRLLGERSGRGVWVATLAAFAGVAVLAGPKLGLALGPALVSLLGALFSAFSMIWLRRLGASGTRASPEAIVLHFSLVASAATVALSVPAWQTPDAAGVLLLGATGVAGGLAQLAMTRAYALDRAARMGAISYLGVVLSHLFGAAWLDERPSARQAIGAALIVLAGTWLALNAVRDARRGPGAG